MELLSGTVFSIRSVQNNYIEENWGNQFSLALQGRLRRDGAIVEFPIDKRSARAAVRVGP
jgi:hypothetical protein